MKIIQKEFNAITGKTTITERDLTEAEIVERQAFQSDLTARAAADKVATDAKASRDAKLAKMGFSLAEIENW